MAPLSQISFFCLLSRLELQERKPSWGTEKLRTFWCSNLEGFLSLVGYLKVLVHTMTFSHQYLGNKSLFQKEASTVSMHVGNTVFDFLHM